jgi:hypothetical protein
MKLHVLGLSVAFAFASLMPVTAADSRTSGGFSRSTTSRSDTAKPAEKEPAKPEVKTSPQTQTQGGFTRTVPDAGRQSGGFTRDKQTEASPSATGQPQPRVSGGFSRDANPAAGATTTTVQRAVPLPVAAPSAVDRLAQRSNSKAAFAQFQQERTVYKAPPVGEPANQKAAQSSTAWKQYGSGWKTSDDYYARRNAAFARQPDFQRYYVSPPIYINRPSYGGYAAAFLGGVMLDHIMNPGYASWAYSHQSDPGYEAWHQDMMHQAQDNEELRTKMATLDQQVADLKAKNAPISEALPPDVDPSMVVAPSTVLVATTSESSGHPILYTILGIVIGILAALGFLWLCLKISRNRAVA